MAKKILLGAGIGFAALIVLGISVYYFEKLTEPTKNKVDDLLGDATTLLFQAENESSDQNGIKKAQQANTEIEQALAIVQGLATFLQTPPKILVRKNLSKARHEYFTFITDLGAKKILAYINSRILGGESLGPDSPVIAPKIWHKNQRGRNNGKQCLPTSRIALSTNSPIPDILI